MLKKKKSLIKHGLKRTKVRVDMSASKCSIYNGLMYCFLKEQGKLLPTTAIFLISRTLAS